MEEGREGGGGREVGVNVRNIGINTMSPYYTFSKEASSKGIDQR